MAVIRIMGENSQYKRYEFKQILSATFQSDRFTPADIFEFAVLDDIKAQIFTRVALYIDGKLRFKGIVDVQKKHIGQKGCYANFVCRHEFCALLDNEVKPYVYSSLNSEQLIKTHAMPYGIKGHKFPKVAVASEIVAYKGMSHWEFIELFCQLCYKKAPYVDGDGYITLSSVNDTIKRFSNIKSNYINFSDATITYDTFNIISKLFLKTGKDDIGAQYYYVMNNALARRFNINRTRYHNSSREWLNDLEQNARNIITQQNLDFFEIEIIVPEILDIEVGDNSEFSDPIGEHKFLYVSQIKFIYDANGQKSVVKLWSREIV